MNIGTIGCALGAGLVSGAGAQVAGGSLGAAALMQTTARASDGGGSVGVRGPVVASLTYDGVNTYGFKGQDFESVFDLYDIYVCEVFSISDDANLGAFSSVAFGNGNPFGATDVIVEVYDVSQLEEICDDGDLPSPVMRSMPGVGFYDGVQAVSDFGDQCLEASEYILRWAVELNFGTYGQIFFFGQFGEHDNGGGYADDGFQSNPGGAIGLGPCFDAIEGATGEPIGINFVLGGRLGDCGPGCPDVNGCGDWDNDGDSDADDFFGYLDSFTSGDPCADLDGCGDIDADDFFRYLDRFVHDC